MLYLKSPEMQVALWALVIVGECVGLSRDVEQSLLLCSD